MKSFYSKRVIKLLLYDKQRGKCNDCKQPFPIRNLEIDHIIPRAGGGSDIPSNFQLLCKPCNLEKRAFIESGSQYTLFDAPKDPKHNIRFTRYEPNAKPGPSLTPSAAKKRAQRERARIKGVCIMCITLPARPGRATCEPCGQKAQRRVERARENERVALSPAERQRRYRAKRKPGYCITCTKNKAVKGKTKCESCAKAALEAAYRSQGKEPPKKRKKH